MQRRPSGFSGFTVQAVGVPLLVAVALAATVLVLPGRGRARAADRDAPYAIDARVPWTGGRVTGSPEPPPPYQVERVFPNLTFKEPVEIAFVPGSDRVCVVELSGKIFSFPNDTNVAQRDLFADLTKDVRHLDKVENAAGFQQVFGIAFHPQYQKNHYCYLCYCLQPKSGVKFLPNGERVSRFTVIDKDPQTGEARPPRIDPDSEVVLLEWQGGGHMGGCLKFGPDGYLYATAGDAADPNPPDVFNTGQDISDLLSSVMRIDVDHGENGKPYAIPADNPFIHTPGARPEVWAYGFRNPWRISFDRQTGQLWAGDVGWELWEMVDHVVRGGNYGWSITEGPQPVHADAKPGPTPILKPELSLPHSESASVTGGYVYRGKRLPELVGHYVFGDWETRRLWAANCEGPDGGKLAPNRTIAVTDLRVITFGEDADGELYVMDYEGGGIYRLGPNPDANKVSNFPRKLSETGLFASVREQSSAPGVLPFVPNAAQWNDGATAERFVAVPGTERVTLNEEKKVFPKDSVLVRTFSLGGDAQHPEQRRRVETQLLHFDGKRWNGYTYQWNDQQTDADLVDGAGAERPFTIDDAKAPGGKREQTWHYASRAQCATCHTSWTDYTLAYNVPQLDRTIAYGGATDNQVRTLRHLGLLPPPQGATWKDGRRVPAPPTPQPLADPYDASAQLVDRARSYLHANCSHCHRFGGGGAALIDLRFELKPSDTHAIDAPPLLGDFGIGGAKIVASGDPARSVLLCRMAKLGRGRMPHIGSYDVDRAGATLMEQWIAGLSPTAAQSSDAVEKARHEEAAAFQAVRGADASAPEVSKAIDRLLSTTSGALTLVCGMDQGRLSGPVRQEVIDRAAASSQETVRDVFEPFLPSDKRIARLGSNIDPAKLLAMGGNAGRGREIFFVAGGGLCRQCHKVNGEGEDFGPDLSHIATKYDRAALLDNILHPSKTIDPQYVSYAVKTADGDDYIGLLVERTPKEVVLKDAQRQVVRIPAEKVTKLTPQTTSIMPEGLLGGLMAQQAADLLEYLQGLK